MSGQGAPVSQVRDAHDVRVVVIAAQWHAVVMDGLIAGATRALTQSGASWELVRVPGTFELPVAAARLIEAYDAVVALGVVIRGGTPHFEYVCQAATEGLTTVAVASRKPVGFGVLTCDNEQQALDRAGLPGSSEDKGYEAASAAIETVLALRDAAPTSRPVGF